MNAAVILIVGIVILALGYVFYGGWLSKQWGIDPSRPTPAHELEDGMDYCPAKAPVLMGHHFSSIAGAGPINGPIQAAVFGWVPVLLWVLIGGIFFGGVHDYGALFASVRNDGQSIGTVVETSISKKAKRLFLIFSYLTLILVVAAFASIVANTFKATYVDGGRGCGCFRGQRHDGDHLAAVHRPGHLLRFLCVPQKCADRRVHDHRCCGHCLGDVAWHQVASDLPELPDLDDHLRHLHSGRFRHACLDPAPAA